MQGDVTDLTGSSCSVDPCSEPVETLGVATIGLPYDVGAIEENLTLALPLCGYHAHLLRMGARTWELDSRE